MTNELLQLEAIIRSVKTLVDGGLSLTVNTQELRPEDSTKLFELKGKFGFMVFKPTRVSEEEMAQVPDEVKEFKKEKSMSERLYAVMYVKWKQLENAGKTKEDFNEFRKRHMNIIIDKYKDTLDEK